MKRRILKILYLCCLIILLLEKKSYGYLDPSAMTYVIQIIAAIGITITTSIGILFYKIKKLFKKKKEKLDNKNNQEN